MIPFLTQPGIQVGPIGLHAFGVIVAIAVYVGLELGQRRFRRFGLDTLTAERFAWFTLAGGFLGAHLFSVLVYFPDKVARNPLVLLKVWEDISSFGGMLGAVAGMGLFFWRNHPELDARARMAFVDVAAFVFAISLAIGRIACSLAHDHPGTVTHFPLAISLQSPAAREYITSVYADAGRLATLPPPDQLAALGFHDLGWYEFLYLAIVVIPAMLALDRWFARRHGHATPPTGLFVATFVVLYMPVRFLLDFLRVQDVRYAGLTPGQWVAMAALGALAIVAARRALARARVPRAKGDEGPRDDTTSASGRVPPTSPPAACFWIPLVGVAALDVVTKYLAHVRLRSAILPQEVLGDAVRWTLLYNPGAAFGLNVGPHSRWIFLGITTVILGVLWHMYRATPADRWLRALALGLVVGGAIGNLVNRIWSSRGVVDFIDVGIGQWRWPSFNVADIGVTTGAILLTIALHREETRTPRAAPSRPADDR